MRMVLNIAVRCFKGTVLCVCWDGDSAGFQVPLLCRAVYIKRRYLEEEGL